MELLFWITEREKEQMVELLEKDMRRFPKSKYVHITQRGQARWAQRRREKISKWLDEHFKVI